MPLAFPAGASRLAMHELHEFMRGGTAPTATIRKSRIPGPSFGAPPPRHGISGLNGPHRPKIKVRPRKTTKRSTPAAVPVKKAASPAPAAVLAPPDVPPRNSRSPDLEPASPVRRPAHLSTDETTRGTTPSLRALLAEMQGAAGVKRHVGSRLHSAKVWSFDAQFLYAALSHSVSLSGGE
jgi:hypothetical protein